MLDLNFDDTRDVDFPARLTENLSYEDLVDSQQQCISVQYNQIKIARANPLIFHFALDPNNHNQADRARHIRNPRVYFMVGRNGMIHILFFDPYHEIDP